MKSFTPFTNNLLISIHYDGINSIELNEKIFSIHDIKQGKYRLLPPSAWLVTIKISLCRGRIGRVVNVPKFTEYRLLELEES
jgi:hypothetical protein